jgi:hypothetical protein
VVDQIGLLKSGVLLKMAEIPPIVLMFTSPGEEHHMHETGLK